MILVLGATGFLGRHVCKKLDKRGVSYISTSRSLGVDFRNKEETLEIFKKSEPEYVLNCAAYVGGIQFGRKYPVDIFHNNLMMTLNILESAKEVGVKKIVNPISNCAYPAKATLFKESEFWDGPLHDSVMVYGFVRKAFWVGSWAYHQQFGMDVVNLIFSNMYGPDDHFEEERSHALGALIMKFTKAKMNNEPNVVVWGTGTPVREWLHVHDGAEAMIRAIGAESVIEPVNVGVASGISIKAMAEKIKACVGYTGEIVFDTTKPDGAAYKTVDGSRGAELLDWKPEIDFETGVNQSVQWYLDYIKSHASHIAE